MESPWVVGKIVYINGTGTGHMTKMAAMLIYGKNYKTNSPMIMKLCMEQDVL